MRKIPFTCLLIQLSRILRSMIDIEYVNNENIGESILLVA